MGSLSLETLEIVTMHLDAETLNIVAMYIVAFSGGIFGSLITQKYFDRKEARKKAAAAK